MPAMPCRQTKIAGDSAGTDTRSILNPLAPIARCIDAELRKQLLEGDGVPKVNFLEPVGEPALAGPDSVSWRVFRNPLSLYIGGITAVLLELAEPRVRTGVWEHTQFRTDPLRRMRRTGLAAMVTVYGARSSAERMIRGIGEMHARVAGHTPEGEAYRADDPELLRWVHATALFGFMEAYHRYVRGLSPEERDRFIAEGVAAARLYGACDPPESDAELRALLDHTEPSLESSAIITEFLVIMERLSLFPRPLRPINRWLITAAIDLLPVGVRRKIITDNTKPASRFIQGALRRTGMAIDRLHLPSAPASQACQRIGLPSDHLQHGKR